MLGEQDPSAIRHACAAERLRRHGGIHRRVAVRPPRSFYGTGPDRPGPQYPSRPARGGHGKLTSVTLAPVSIGPYRMNAAFMLLVRRERGIHIV
jgi:hypothetical protein